MDGAPPSVASGDTPQTVVSTPLGVRKVTKVKQEIDYTLCCSLFPFCLFVLHSTKYGKQKKIILFHCFMCFRLSGIFLYCLMFFLLHNYAEIWWIYVICFESHFGEYFCYLLDYYHLSFKLSDTFFTIICIYIFWFIAFNCKIYGGFVW